MQVLAEQRQLTRAFHNPTRERGTGHARRQGDVSRSLAYASGWDENHSVKFICRTTLAAVFALGTVANAKAANSKGFDPTSFNVKIRKGAIKVRFKLCRL